MKNEKYKKPAFKLTVEQLQMLDSEREMHLKGQTKSYTREQATQIIKGKDQF